MKYMSITNYSRHLVISIIFSFLFLFSKITWAGIGMEFYNVGQEAYVDDNAGLSSGNYNENFGSSLPISSYTVISQNMQSGYGFSKIYKNGENNVMYADSYANNALLDPFSYSYAYASANSKSNFWGASILKFSYSYNYNMNIEGFHEDSDANNQIYVDLYVSDKYYTVLWFGLSANGVENNFYNESGADTLYIPISASGTEIDLYIHNFASAAGNASAGGDLTFTYNMSVVPEPISSILFISGGAIMMFMYNKKRRE